jgi:hypothetical protein
MAPGAVAAGWGLACLGVATFPVEALGCPGGKEQRHGVAVGPSYPDSQVLAYPDSMDSRTFQDSGASTYRCRERCGEGMSQGLAEVALACCC